MRILRRLLLLLALMVWQGGFMFYGAIVVPVGSEVLGSHREQGFVTRSVTNYLNVAGAVCLAVWCWDVVTERGAGLGWQRLRWVGWVLLVILLGVRVLLHLRLDELLDVETFSILDRPRFHLLHQGYLIVSTLQWGVAVVMTALTIRTWRDADSART